MVIFLCFIAIMIYSIFGMGLFTLLLECDDFKFIRKNRLFKAILFFVWPLAIVLFLFIVLFGSIFEIIKQILEKEE